MDKTEEILKKMKEIADRMEARHEEYVKHKDEIEKGDFSNYDVSK